MSLSQTGTFVETIIDLVDGATRANIIGFSSNNKLVLNGREGADGGSGIPWGGLVGCLIQRRVCFDTTETATPCILPSSSLLDNLNRIRWHHKPATWFEISPTDPRSMRVHVASGLWYKDEADYVDFTGGNSPIITSPVANPRIDVVYLTPSGIIAVASGTESASPIFTIPSGIILPIGAVYVTPVACGIGWPCDTDLYSGSLYSGYIYKDLRPFITYPGGGGGAAGLWTDYGTYVEVTDPNDVRIGTGQKLYPEDATGQDLGDATHAWDLYTQEINFTGGNDTNIIIIPNDQTNAFYIDDTGGREYLRINTSDAPAQSFILFNSGEADVDFTVAATMVSDAFFIQGSDGEITFGAYGAGHLSSTVGGVIESATNITMADGAWIGNAVGDMRIIFHAADRIEIATDGSNIYTIDDNPAAATPMTATAANINITGGSNITGDDAGLWLRNEETNIDWSIYVDESDSDHLKIARENTEVAEFDTVGNFRMFSGNDIDPEDATGQDLGSSAHRWDLYANDINMDNGGVIHCTTLGGPIITFDSISDYLEITECRISIGHAAPVVALDINTPTWNHNGILLGSGGPPANLGMVKFTGLDFFGFTPSGWLSLTASGTGGGGGASLWTDHGAFIEPTNPRNVRIGTGQEIYPEDATGQDLGRGGNRWDIWARYIDMSDAGWVGNSAAVARLHFDSSGGTDYAYFMSCYVGFGTVTPGNFVDVVTGATTNSSVHIGEAIDEGGYITSTVDSQMMFSSGSELVAAGWVARATTASIINLYAGRIYFYCDDGLVDGNAFAPSEVGRVDENGDWCLGSAGPTATVRLRVYEATDDVFLYAETDKVNGAAQAYFLNDAQSWRVGVDGTDTFIIRDATVGASPVTIEPGADTNSLYIDADGHVGFGANPTADYTHYIYKGDTAATSIYVGLYNYHRKTSGVSDQADAFYGFLNTLIYNHAAGEVGSIYGLLNQTTLTDGQVGSVANNRSVSSLYNLATLTAGTINGNMYGHYNLIDGNGATITGDMLGQYVFLDLDGTAITGSAYGLRVRVDRDAGSIGGNLITLWVDSDTNVDYGIYADGAAPHYFAGSVGIGIVPTKKLSVNGSIDTSTALGIRAYRSTTQTIVTDTWTALNWDTQVYDTDAGFAPTSTIMYSKSAGYYIAGGGCTFSTTSLNGEIRVIKNGTTVLARASFTLTLSNTRMNICTGMIYLAVNDYIEIEVYHSRGSDALISAANTTTHNNNYGFLVRTA